jgi:hypothetical protein
LQNARSLQFILFFCFFCGIVKIVSFSLVFTALKCRRKADNGIRWDIHIWDAVSNEAVAESCLGLPVELAAKLVIKVTLHVANNLQYQDAPCLLA